MGFEVAQVAVLRRKFLLVRHVNQVIESGAIRVARDHRLELLLMQAEHFLYAQAERN